MGNFEERIRNLSVNQRLLLLKQLGTKNWNAEKSRQILVAYFTSNKALETKEMRKSLKKKLPEYMIPSRFVLLDEFPRLPNGKVDVNALNVATEQNSVLHPNFEKPVTDIEKQLVIIWEEVLNFHPIKVNDNFFEIGGDSILSIHIVSKARKKGVVLAPNQLFEHQTIRELARFAKDETEENSVGPAVGNVPLIPVQHWFFEEHKNAPNHWNQAMIFEANKDLDISLLRKSVELVVLHHDALQLNFQKVREDWVSTISEEKNQNGFQVIDLSDISLDKIDKTIESMSAELQSRLILSKSTLFQVVFFDSGDKNKDKVLLFAHHLVVDGVSWRILTEDIETTYQQLKIDETVSVFSNSSSFKKWGEYLVELAESNKLEPEIEFWKAQTANVSSFPRDFENELPYLVKSVRVIESIIESDIANDFIRHSNRAYGTNTEEILISALIIALEKWRGIKAVNLGLERHGRESGETGIDLNDTVGWFTTYFPVKLHVAKSKNLKSTIIATKETLRKIPNQGLGYGVLRYLKKEKGFNQRPAIRFNYLGRRESINSEVLGSGEWKLNGAHSPETERFNLIGINAFLKGGRLHTVFDFSEKLYKIDTIESLIEEYENQIVRISEHCEAQESIGYAPSDFAEADLTQEDLDNLLTQIT